MTEPTASAAPDDLSRMMAAFERLRLARDQVGGLPVARRKALLKALLKAVRANKAALVDAIAADFGARSPREILLAEIFTTVEGIKHTRAHLDDWLAPRPVESSWHYQPGAAHVEYQPLGVVGIVVPWNYPLYLALSPLVGAIAAGNRVLIKPSELSPATAEALTRLLAEIATPDEIAVVTGGPEVGAAFSALPLNHLFFTGSTAVGRKVMATAAANLTPVTLELGGKSPALVHQSFDLARAATRIAAGKMLNAGQTCIAPDYVLVPADKVDAFAEAYGAAVRKMVPALGPDAEYTAIISANHLRRLEGLLSEARAAGARVIEILPAPTEPDPHRRMGPTVVLGATDGLRLMQEEIFGPILPVLPYKDLDEAIARINAGPRPLALYYFDWNKKRQAAVCQRTTSGGVTLNDTLFHIAQENLPFGGVGASGLGSYHGWHSFRTFSHEKGVHSQARLNLMPFFTPPYSRLTDALLRLLIG